MITMAHGLNPGGPRYAAHGAEPRTRWKLRRQTAVSVPVADVEPHAASGQSQLVSEPTSTAQPSDFPAHTPVPWRPLGAAAASLGTPIGIGVLHPMFGQVIVVIEIVMVLTIILTALFGSQTLSERAFRLLRWVGNRSEPPPPDTVQAKDRDGAMTLTARPGDQLQI